MNQAKKSDFIQRLSKIITTSLNNQYVDNYDFGRFPVSAYGPEKEFVNREENMSFLLENINLFSQVYDLLEDRESRDLYLLLTAFKVLGHKKIRLPLSTKEYWNERDKIEQYVNSGKEAIDSGLLGWKLYLTDLSFYGIPVREYVSGVGFFTDYILKQYEYVHSGVRIGAKPGDIVIDGGACWGDTALYFANIVGNLGKVFSFEFTRNNLEIFKKNIDLNPDLEKRIVLIEKPLWKNSQDELYFNEDGPGTQVSLNQKGQVKPVKAISIDSLVSEKKLGKIDFIKMDIEGSEQAAISGSVETLKRFKPQLAITIYHNKMQDFIHVPLLLKSLNLGYKFYVGHFTIYHEETVLFATI